MHAPLRLEKAVNAATLMNFVVTPDGTLYAPKYGSSDVLVFAFDGTPLPPLPLKALGLSTSTLSAAFVHDFVEDTGTLLLADANGAFSKLVAVDTASTTVCWSASMGISCYGIAVLPAQGVVVASDYSLDKLHARRLSDGAHIASVAAVNSTYTAVDPATATIYSSTICNVSIYRWDDEMLVFDGVVEEAVKEAGTTDPPRPLAVVPPAPGPESGQRTSFLVVGTFRCPTLHVFSLPDHRLIHTHELEEMKVVGLAADPSGNALAVCDGASKAIHVLPWPLPGMRI
jgi:hypothetical protein